MYLLVFHRHHGANARVQSSTADDKQSCLFAPISSVRQFCCRSKPNVITGPAGRTAAPKTIGVKELRFFSQIMQVRWPPTFSPVSFLLPLAPPRRPRSLSLPLSRSHSLDSLRLGLAGARVFVALLCQPGLLPLLPDHCANSSTYSFIPPVLFHNCALLLPPSLFFSLA